MPDFLLEGEEDARFHNLEGTMADGRSLCDRTSAKISGASTHKSPIETEQTPNELTFK